MKPHRVPALARWLVAATARLVPSHRRERWRSQWRAELLHRWTRDGSAVRLVVFALGALPHAVFLRREEATMRGLWADLRHSARALLRQPGFTTLTLATFAIGVGSATAIFSLAEALLLRPLPLEDEERLVAVFSTQPRNDLGRFSVSYPDYRDLTGREDLFEAASLWVERSRDVAGGLEPERVRSVAVHEGFFQTLGSPVRLGRVFTAEDHDERSPLSVVLSESFWSVRLGGDPGAVGSDIRLDGVPHTVVGVVGDRYGWPSGADLWTPLQWGDAASAHAGDRSNHAWQVVARLRPGVDVTEASDQVRAMARAIYARTDIDPRDEGTEAIVVPLRSSAAGDDTGSLFATLGGAVLFVLLIACMNASGLLLVRAWSRTREISLRSALGAGRARLTLIVLGESAILAVLGGALGIGLGVVGLDHLFGMAPPEITALGDPGLNPLVLATGLAISLGAALLAGVVPAMRASGISVAECLKEGAGQASGGRTARRLRKALVAAEVALSLVLLVGAGLTMRGFQRQLATDPGFDVANLLSFTVRLPEARYGDDALVDAYFDRAVERLRRHPAVLEASSTSRLPLGAGGLSLGRAFAFDGSVPPPDGPSYGAAWVEVDPEWFATLGIRALEGRVFGPEDGEDTTPVAVVNRRMARLMSPDEPIVGRRVRSVYDENLARTVVGVIPDIQIRGVSRDPRQALVLVPRAQSVRRSMAFVLRTAGEPGELLPAVRATMSEIDPDVAVSQLRTLRGAHRADLGGIRFLTSLFGAFGLLALVLAVGGVYGLVSYSVTQRRKEIGVRMALGASSGRVRRAVLGESVSMGAVGLAVGLVLAYGMGRILAVGMSGVAVVEASTYVAVALLLSVAVVAATWVPARRATRVDPVEATRSE